MDKTVFCTC